MHLIRDFRIEDSAQITRLFCEAYEERYVYASLYMPSMIEKHNAQGSWHSVVAQSQDGTIVGHAALWQANQCSAELGLMVVSASARKAGLATQIAVYLLDKARNLGLQFLTVKMVCSHPYTQRLFYGLGFTTTALVLDRVTSPYAKGERESIVYGLLPLHPTPIPKLNQAGAASVWLELIAAKLGTDHAGSAPDASMGIEVSDQGDGIEIALHSPNRGLFTEIAQLPRSRLIFLKISLQEPQFNDWTVLYESGFWNCGLVPDHQGNWYWLMQRGAAGFKKPTLICPIAQAILNEHLNANGAAA